MRNRTSASLHSSESNAPVRLTIERIVPGGAGIGFADGRAILVPETAPGDVVDVTPGARGPLARLVRIVEPGPDRIAARCQHYGVCGGCDLMHLNYPAQLEAKREIIIDALKRTGNSDVDGLLSVVANSRPFQSRIRATWHPDGEGGAGYLARGSHDPVRIADCLILDPALEAVRADLRITDVTTGLTNGAEVSITDSSTPAKSLNFDAGTTELVTSADAFFQANGGLLNQFVDHVINAASPAVGEQIWDLYAGIGLFSMPLAEAGANVLLVESGDVAVRFARHNARAIRAGSIEIHHTTVEHFLGHKRPAPDVVVIDPPRTGLSQRAIRGLILVRPPRIVSVSCDPVTYARDHRVLTDAGYRLGSLVAFDLYPQTHHVELVGNYALDDSV